MKKILTFSLLIAFVAMCGLFFNNATDTTAEAEAASTPQYTNSDGEYVVLYSDYSGWIPVRYAQFTGIMAKHAKKYNVKIKVTKPMTYDRTLELYPSGKYAGVVITNMDVLASAFGGIDSTVVVVGDYSNGNDGVVSQDGSQTMQDLKGKKINLTVASVSDYLLTRCLSMAGMTSRDVKISSSNELAISAGFQSKEMQNVVTWNPTLMQIRNMPNARLLCDSSKIPEEIVDMIVVQTGVPAGVKKAIAGAWYEVMGIMQNQRSKTGKLAIEKMASAMGCSTDEYKAQLRTTNLYYTPEKAISVVESAKFKKTMTYVRDFCFEKGVFEGADTPDSFGIVFPDGTILGNAKNIKLRYSTEYMNMAAKGLL